MTWLSRNVSWNLSSSRDVGPGKKCIGVNTSPWFLQEQMEATSHRLLWEHIVLTSPNGLRCSWVTAGSCKAQPVNGMTGPVHFENEGSHLQPRQIRQSLLITNGLIAECQSHEMKAMRTPYILPPNIHTTCRNMLANDGLANDGLAHRSEFSKHSRPQRYLQ